MASDLRSSEPAAMAPVALQHIDPDHPDHRDSVHQRLRANSSIMQVKKLLGMSLPPPLTISTSIESMPLPYLHLFTLAPIILMKQLLYLSISPADQNYVLISL